MIYNLLLKCNPYPYVISTEPIFNKKAVIAHNELASGFRSGSFSASLMFLTGLLLDFFGT